MTENDDVYLVEMRGRLGYRCETRVSAANAKNDQEACAIAGMMFPELVPVRANIEVHPRGVPA